MNKKMIWLAVPAFFLAFSQASIACGEESTGEMHTACGCKKELATKLDLTMEQQAKIKVILMQAKVVKIEKQKDIQPINDQIRALIESSKIDDKKLDELLKQKTELMVVYMKNKIMVKHQIYNILNPKQRIQYDEIIKTWEEKGMEKLGNNI